MRNILTGLTAAALALAGCDRDDRAEPAAENTAAAENVTLPADETAAAPAGNAADGNEAVTEQGSTDHGSTDH